MEPLVSPTPPATQAMDVQEYVADQPTRHETFYCLDETLLDPVILQVCPPVLWKS